MKLVIHPALDGQRLQLVEDAAGEMLVVNCDTEDSALQEITAADAFFGKLTPELLAQAQQLRWVQSPTASLEHYLFPQLVDHPCQLTNMRGLFYDVIADHVLGYILMFSRRLHHYLRQQLASDWRPLGGEQARTSFATGPGEVSEMDRAHLHVSDQVMGIIGLGSIGAEIARRGKAFGMRVLGIDPSTEATSKSVDEIRDPTQLEWLLQESDFVVIAAPHTPLTEGLIGADQLALMKPSAYLINIGRGVIVQLDPLVAALEQGSIAGAALDVFEIEPLPADHPLWKMDNVLITPHVAACSVRVPERHLATLLENIRNFSQGQPLLNVTDKQLWY